MMGKHKLLSLRIRERVESGQRKLMMEKITFHLTSVYTFLQIHFI